MRPVASVVCWIVQSCSKTKFAQRCPLLRGLHTTNLSLQTRVGKLKLVCVNGTKTVGKHVGKLLANMLANCWRQIELVSILANFFANFFVLANSNLTCERLANVCCYLSTNQNTRFSHVICVTLHKMADEDRDATFKFIEEIHNNPAVWDVSSPSDKDTNLKQKLMEQIAEKLNLKGGK